MRPLTSPEADRLHRGVSCRISTRPPPPLKAGQERFLRALVDNESTETFKRRVRDEPWFRRVVWGAVVRTARFWVITARKL
jgi:predicted nicotinamide N-methyase